MVKHYERKLSHDDSKRAEQPVNEVSEEIKTENQTSDNTGSSDDFDVSQSSDWDSDRYLIFNKFFYMCFTEKNSFRLFIH